MKSALPTMILLLASLSGCLNLFGDDEPFNVPATELGLQMPAAIGASVSTAEITWPDLSGATLTILNHGAFAAFDTAKGQFENLTGATVVEVPAADTGSALNIALLDAGDSQYDVFYGVDNILWKKALDGKIFHPYTPQLAPIVDPNLVFFADGHDHEHAWPATPVDHGYIALNIDGDDPLMDAASEWGCQSIPGPSNSRPATVDGVYANVTDLGDVAALSCLFVTSNPNLSTPGLGFMLVTIDAFGENDRYDWLDYWTDLFTGPDNRRCTGDEVKIVPGWSEAYVNHFTGGYGNDDWNDAYVGGRPIVTSYTESPAYEAFFGAVNVSQVLLPGAFHQIQTMGILDGTKNLGPAQAWIEYTLTREFQELAAAENAVYPVVAAIDTDDVYGDLDPAPGSFPTVALDWATIGDNLDGWLDAWQDLFEEHAC